MDIAQLGISVDSRQVKNATGDLAGFATAAGKAEKATDGLEKASGRFYDASGRLREANGRFVQGAEKAASATSLLSGGINGATTATQAFGGALASLGIAAATSQLVKMADTYGLLQSKIGLATGEITKAAEATDMVFASAQRARVGLDELGSMVARLAPSIRDMGGTTQDAVAASELFAKTLKISGATAEESASAILQFGQALGTGRLGGEEFNAVNESSGRYMQLLAKELGVTRGELKKMAEDGKLTGEVLINALANNATVLEGEFQQLRVTGAETFEQLSNSTMQAAFEIDKASGVSQTFNGVMNAGRGIIDAVTLALRDTNSTASDTSIIVPAVTKVFQTLGIVAAETVYVFKETGRTLGALAAQAAALAQGDLDLYRRIGEERDRDSAAARAAVDKLTASIVNSETATAKLATTAPKLSTGLKAVKTSADDNSKALKAAQRIAEQAADAYGDLQRSLRKQLMTEDELTTAQKVSMDLTDKRYKHLSEKQKANLIALAKEVDAFKAQQQLFKDMAASAQELSESDTKRQQAAVDAAYASYQAVDQQLKKLQEEADTYGMTETEIQRYLLAKAEEKLALERSGEARQGVIDQLNREIETRKELVSATSGSEMRKATDALGERVQGTLSDAIKDGLAADNPIKGFAKSLGNSVKNALMNAVATGLSARIVAALGMGGVSASAAAGGGDVNSIFSILSSGSGGNSIGAGLANGALGGEFGIFANAGNVSNMALAGYGLAGGLFGNLVGAGQTGSLGGSLGAGLGALAGFGPLGIAASALGGTVLGGLLGGSWGGNGGSKSGGNYNAAFVGGMATNENFFGGYTPSQSDAQLKTAVNDFYKNYTQTVKDLGGVAKDLTVNLGFDTDPAGSAGNRLSAQVAVGAVTAGERELWQASVLSMVSESVGEIPEAINLATGKMLLAALKESDLPSEYARVFNGVDINSATQEQITAMQNALSAIKTLNAAFDNFGKTLPQLAGLTYEAKAAIATFGGGLETFSGSLNSYVDLYYSDAEKAAMATKQLQSQFSQLNITMPASTAEFRKMVEAQDLTTESGRKTYAALISLSGAFDGAADAAKAANEALLTGALSTLADSIAAEQEAINAAADATIEGYEKQIEAQQALADAAEKSAASISEVIGILQSGITSLRGYSFEQGRSFITSAIAQARAGGAPDKEQLSAAVDAVKAIDESGFSTKEELERVKASAAADMDTLQAIAGTQLTAAQQQLNAADEQIKRLNALIESTVQSRDAQISALDLLYQTQEKQVNELLGIHSATLSVKDAIEGLGALISSQKPPSTGGGSVPSGGSGLSAIDQIYRDVLGREADFAGLNFYGGQLLSGKSIDQIRAEIAASEEAKAINGSHRNGLASVPFDGYRAELHAGERVLTAQQADSSDKMAADIAEMRREVFAAMYAIAANTLRTAKLQERWDGDGLPDPRGY